MAKIKISSAKAKGRNLQKLIAEKISVLLGIDCGYEDDKLIQPRIMGQSGTDIVLRGEALERFPFSVECKSSETWALPAYIKQAKKNMLKDTNWLLFLKRKEFKNPVVVMDADVFFNLLECIEMLYKDKAFLIEEMNK